MKLYAFAFWKLSVISTPHSFPVQYIRSGKEHFIYFDLVFQPLRNDNGEPIAVISLGNDVTYSVLACKEIEESEIRFRALAETLPQMTWVRNMDGKIVYGLKNWERYSGIKDVSEANPSSNKRVRNNRKTR